jgi:hypothetical protein
MRCYIRPALLVIALLFATIPVAADSLLHGEIEGIELCPQSLCGLAVFAGGFDGSINGAPTRRLRGRHQPRPATSGGGWRVGGHHQRLISHSRAVPHDSRSRARRDSHEQWSCSYVAADSSRSWEHCVTMCSLPPSRARSSSRGSAAQGRPP